MYIFVKMCFGLGVWSIHWKGKVKKGTVGGGQTEANHLS